MSKKEMDDRKRVWQNRNVLLHALTYLQWFHLFS